MRHVSFFGVCLAQNYVTKFQVRKPWEDALAVPVEEAYVKAWGALFTQELEHAAENLNL